MPTGALRGGSSMASRSPARWLLASRPSLVHWKEVSASKLAETLIGIATWRDQVPMTTMSMSNPLAGRSLWIVDSRTIVYAAIGAALYGVLGLFDFLLPGTTNIAIRPAFGLVTFFGFAFGPITGFFTGFVGNAITDQLHNYGFLTYWNWSLANGLAGFVAGLAPLYLARMIAGNISRRAL